jgi:hypothetical protein
LVIRTRPEASPSPATIFVGNKSEFVLFFIKSMEPHSAEFPFLFPFFHIPGTFDKSLASDSISVKLLDFLKLCTSSTHLIPALSTLTWPMNVKCFLIYNSYRLLRLHCKFESYYQKLQLYLQCIFNRNFNNATCFLLTEVISSFSKMSTTTSKGYYNFQRTYYP